MHRRKKYIQWSLVGLLLWFVNTACVKEIHLDDLRPNPTMVVNCVAATGEPLRVSVSRTWFFTDDHSNILLDDAQVELFVNNEFREAMGFQQTDKVFNTNGYFTSDFIPEAGDRIRIEVSHPSFGKAEAETIVPDSVEIIDASMRLIQTDNPNTKTAVYEVTLKDDPSVTNYYLLRLEEGVPIFDGISKKYTGEYQWLVTNPNFATDPIFGQAFSALDQVVGNDWISGRDGRAFSDELINGQEYTIRVLSPYYLGPMSFTIPSIQPSVPLDQLDENDYLPIPLKLRVHLYAISPDYYWYLKVLQDKETQSVSNSLIDAGLAEPLRVYSNVEGGIGILGGCHIGIFDRIVEVNK